MTTPVHMAPLGSEDARQIAALQKIGFAAALRESVSEITEILKNTEQHLVCNYSFGLYDDTRMVGYLFGYVESESIFHERNEDVLYIKEVVLTPGYESYFPSMFLKVMELRQAFSPGIPIEAHAEPDTLARWRRMKRTFRRYGLSLQSKEEPIQPNRPLYHLIRINNLEDLSDFRISQRKLPLQKAVDSNISVTLLKDARQWAALQPVWDDLLRQTDDFTVFQSFDYLYTWWQNFGLWNELRIFVFHRGDTIVGVTPLMLEYFKQFSKIVRKLLFITAPMEMSRPKLVLGAETDACQVLLLDYLRKHRDSWDCFDIDEQPMGSATNNLASRLSAEGYLVARTETLCPYIDLDGTWEGFQKSLSKRMRSNINRLRRKLDDTGAVEVELIDRWPDLQVALEQYDAIEARSWKYEKGLHIGADKEMYFFYHQLAQKFGSRGQFQLRQLSCDHRVLSSTFGLLYDGVFQSLKIAHDSAYDKLSPGTILESYEIEQLFGSEATKYEFMGSFLTNKLRWTTNIYQTDNLQVYQRQPRLLLYFSIFMVLEPLSKAFLKRIGLFENTKRLYKRLSAWRER